MVQVDGTAVLAGACLPLTTITLVPATAVTPPAVHEPPILGAGAIRRPDGGVSVKLKLCAGLLAGLVIVKVSIEAPPALMVVGLNALFRLDTNVGACTVSVSLELLLLTLTSAFAMYGATVAVVVTL